MKRTMIVAAALALALTVGASRRGEAGFVYYAINAGGGAAGIYAADAYYHGDTFVDVTTNNPINTALVADPAPQAVYQTGRFGDGHKSGNFDYIFPGLTPGGTYDVRLDFAELYYNAAGRRVFNVAINGTPELTNFDIYAQAGGQYIALMRTFSVQADAAGTIDVKFTSVVDFAKISGLVISAVPEPSSFALTGLALAGLAGAGAARRRAAPRP